MKKLINTLRGRHFGYAFLSVCACAIVLATYSDVRKRRGPFWDKYRQVQLSMWDVEVEAILGPPAETESIGGGTSNWYMLWRDGERTITVWFGAGTGRVMSKEFLPRMWWQHAWDPIRHGIWRWSATSV
jgi:hypothetical protein